MTAALCNLCSVCPACIRKVASPCISPSSTHYARPQEKRKGAAFESMPTMSCMSDAVLRDLPRSTECEIRIGILSFRGKPFHLFEWFPGCPQPPSVVPHPRFSCQSDSRMCRQTDQLILKRKQSCTIVTSSSGRAMVPITHVIREFSSSVSSLDHYHFADRSGVSRF